MRLGSQREQRSNTTRLLGRTAELDSLAQVLDELDGGGARAIELVGEPGLGRRACCRSSRLMRSCGDTSSSRGRRRSWSATCRFRFSCMRWMSTSRASTPTGCRLSTTTCKENSRTYCRRCLRSQAVERWRSSTSAIAAIGRCARCSSIWRRPARWSSSSTTSTGPTRPRSSYWAHSCDGRPQRPCSPHSLCARAKRRSVLWQRSSGRTVRPR